MNPEPFLRNEMVLNQSEDLEENQSGHMKEHLRSKSILFFRKWEVCISRRLIVKSTGW